MQAMGYFGQPIIYGYYIYVHAVTSVCVAACQNSKGITRMIIFLSGLKPDHN